MKDPTLKILLVEDDEDDYILTRDLLEEVKGVDYELTWISRYSEALEAVRQGDHDACLIDYRLGEGTGIELVRDAVSGGCRVPMILLTGQGDQDIDIEATEAGAADYLIKGTIDSSALERAIRYAVAHKRTHDTLRESENRFRSVVESAHDAIILMDGRGDIVSWNRSAQTVFGYSEAEILHKPVSVLFPSRYSEHLSQNDRCDPLLSSGLLSPGTHASDLYGLRRDGRELPIDISLSSWETARGTFYSGIIRDVTERRELEEQLTHQALHDPLTKLANRALFRDRVTHALEKAGRKRGGSAVLFLDLDNFKNINDTLGHAAGDELLVSVASRLAVSLRASDTAARLGGDEFAVLVEDTTGTDGAVLVAERIMEVLRPPFSLDGKEVLVGTSIGIATTSDTHDKPEDLLRNADVAMYTAKTQGKNRYAVFETQMHEAIIRRVQFESDMRAALDRCEFELYYQPIVDLESERIMGMEALVRWNHPKLGMIPPSDFIPVAEDCGLIVPLGQWILEQACRQARQWQAEHYFGDRLSMTVNVAGRQFKEDSLIPTVENALATSGFRPENLVLEITESTMLANTEAMIRKLNELKSLGVRLAIDDFGTGYSSLSYLQRFPVDILKIDKSFIDKIADAEGAAVAKAIITISDTLHLKTIAEGIENLTQRVEVKHLGCNLGQGFHFSKPLRVDEMDEFLSSISSTHVPDVVPAPQTRHSDGVTGMGQN